MNLNLTFSQNLGVSLFLFHSLTLQCFFIGILMKSFKDKTLTIDSKFWVPSPGIELVSFWLLGDSNELQGRQYYKHNPSMHQLVR